MRARWLFGGIKAAADQTIFVTRGRAVNFGRFKGAQGTNSLHPTAVLESRRRITIAVANPLMQRTRILLHFVSEELG